MGRKKSTLSCLPDCARIMTRLNRRLARSSGDIWLMSGGESDPPAEGGGSLAAPRPPPERITSTVSRAPTAAPAIPHGRPARQPAAGRPTLRFAPHLWQNLAVEGTAVPHAGQFIGAESNTPYSHLRLECNFPFGRIPAVWLRANDWSTTCTRAVAIPARGCRDRDKVDHEVDRRALDWCHGRDRGTGCPAARAGPL